MRRRTPLLILLLALLVGTAVPLAGPLAQASPAPEGVSAQMPGDDVDAATVEDDLAKKVWLTLAPRSVLPAGGVPLPVAVPSGPPPPPYRTGPAPGSPEVVPPPPLVGGTGALYAVGDSVLLGAEAYLAGPLDGWDRRVDARVSRRVPEGFDLVRMNRDRIGDVLVILLGHNYGGGGQFAGWLEALLRDLTDVPRIVLVTVAEWSPAQPEVNRAIRAAPERWPNVVVADWAATSAANPQFLQRDRVHLTRSGAIALANLIGVMVGPAPSRDGQPPPRPRLLPIPDEPIPTRGSGPTSTTAPPPGSAPTTSVPGTGTTLPASTTSTTGPSTTTTTADTSTTTSPSTSVPSSVSTTPAPPPEGTDGD